MVFFDEKKHVMYVFFFSNVYKLLNQSVVVFLKGPNT